ncbi:hypothetical protein D3C78_20040 [compost metagenome]
MQIAFFLGRMDNANYHTGLNMFKALALLDNDESSAITEHTVEIAKVVEKDHWRQTLLCMADVLQWNNKQFVSLIKHFGQKFHGSVYSESPDNFIVVQLHLLLWNYSSTVTEHGNNVYSIHIKPDVLDMIINFI